MSIIRFAAVAALALAATAPARAVIVSYAAEGRIVSLGDAANSAFSLADAVTATVTFDTDHLYAIEPDGISFIAMGPDAGLNIRVGSQRWTLGDFAWSIAPAPLLHFGAGQAELVTTAANADGSFLWTGLARYGIGSPGAFWFTEPQGGSFDNLGEFGDFRLVATAVPEPTSWAILLSGFALTGAVMRRRRAAVA